MRPRGESASWPSTRYVGQKSRHSPQWTHSFRSVLSSRPCSGLDTANVAPRIQRAVGIEFAFERAHQPDARARITPHVNRALERQWTPLDNERGICAQRANRIARFEQNAGLGGRVTGDE